ncbi:unnamed protein product [Withania somnifera]
MAFNFCLKIGLVLFFILNLCDFIVTSRDLKELSMLERHEKWMARHGRVYKDEIEKEYRFKTFKKNLAVNKYTDLTIEELTASFMGLDTSLVPKDSTATMTTSFKYDSVTEVPPSMDWRKSGTVLGIRDQGQCVRENNGCDGGQMTLAYDDLLRNNGGSITTETNYPYEEAQSVCNTEQSTTVRIGDYQVVPPSESSLLQAVANQPISVGIAADQYFHSYGSGIYDGSCYPRMNHAVTVIGYGTSDDGVKYWLVKNSWGTDWGEQGYIRIARDVGVDGGQCGIAKSASFPTI